MASHIVVLVTGANTGLGFQIVRSLYGSKHPFQIIVGGRSIAKAGQAVKDLAAEFPSSSISVWPLQVDIESDESIQNAFEEVQSKCGRVDVLVNNAGESGPL